MITYEQIEQVNSQLTTIQLGTGGKKKDYVMVPQRVKAFRMLYPEGFIITNIVSHENNIVMMQATAGYYNVHGEPVTLATGFAQEEKNKGMVNGTSYIENCETSAVGRALGFLALGVDGGGICSAEELVNAITAQKQNEGTEYLKAEKQKLENEIKGFDFMRARTELINNGVVEDVPSASITLAQAKTLIRAMRETFG